MNLFLRDVTLDGERRSISIQDGRIEGILPPDADPAGRDPASPVRDRGPAVQGEAPAFPTRILEGRGLHAFPSFRNGHTHVAMVLFRGYGDDMPLMEWLQTRIWPAEGRLTDEDVYLGARLGVLEMIRGGTTFFNEMYWYRPAIVRAVEEMGIRSLVGCTLIDLGDPAVLESQKREMQELAEGRLPPGDPERVGLALAPHSIYTVPPDVLRWIGELGESHDLPVHIHLSETAGEVERCLEAHGCRPAFLLERLGLVNPRLIAVHGQFLDGDELALLGEAGATLVTNPTANLKLATGGIFPYAAARERGVRVCLGTDGAASNNNLDLLEEMKMAALVQKHREVDATVLPAREALAMATSTPAEVFGNGPGALVPGAPADLILVDFSDPSLQPLHDPVSTLVYAANASHVHTTICGGRVLMYDRRVEVCDQEEVVGSAVEAVGRLLARGGTGG
jgi:5-methylthioadenosine/S-adenosylhomocysteine deaminase